MRPKELIKRWIAAFEGGSAYAKRISDACKNYGLLVPTLLMVAVSAWTFAGKIVGDDSPRISPTVLVTATVVAATPDSTSTSIPTPIPTVPPLGCDEHESTSPRLVVSALSVDRQPLVPGEGTGLHAFIVGPKTSDRRINWTLVGSGSLLAQPPVDDGNAEFVADKPGLQRIKITAINADGWSFCGTAIRVSPKQ